MVLYILYYGEFPFEPQNKLKLNEIIKTMITKELLFYATEVIDKKEKELNCKLVNVIKKCLNVNSNMRPTAREISQLLL